MEFHPIEDSGATAQIYVPELIKMVQPKSVLDLGCNTGWWLYWFMQNGIKNIFGIDGSNMLPHLKIPKNKFKVHDLCTPLNLKKKFDMVVCIEVAEHLPEQHANTLVQTAALHGNAIFWSAASPGQGGYNHFNEQPMQYWINKFNALGYTATPLQNTLPAAPHNYYKTNAILFLNNLKNIEK